MAKKSRTELEFALKGRRTDRTAEVLNTIIKYGSLLGCVAMITAAVKTFAGQHTFADLGFKFIADWKISDSVFAVFGGGGVAFGMRQRKLRRDNIQAMGGPSKAREQALDPKRSSSKLTARGTTPAER